MQGQFIGQVGQYLKARFGMRRYESNYESKLLSHAGQYYESNYEKPPWSIFISQIWYASVWVELRIKIAKAESNYKSKLLSHAGQYL